MNLKITVIVCGAVLLIALGAIWFRFRPATVAFDRTQTINVSTGVGQMLAEETATLIQGRGQIVVVADHALEPDRDGRDYRWNAFRAELKKYPAISIAAREIVTPAPEMGTPGCPRAAFLKILDQYADVAAIVFITDLPDWLVVSDGIYRRLAPKLIAMDTMGQLTQRHYGGYFASGLLSELIGARLIPTTAAMPLPKTSREWFDRHYQIYTPQNFESLPE